MIKKARKKPVVIDYMQLTVSTLEAVEKWCGGQIKGTALDRENCVIDIQTLEGEMRASMGDFIIKGVNGEFYPCKPDIFLKTYDLAPLIGRGISDKDRERIKQAARKDFHQCGETLNDTINHVIDDVLNCPRVS